MTTYTDSKYSLAASSYISNRRADGQSTTTINNTSRILRLYGNFLSISNLAPNSTETVAAWKHHLSEDENDKPSTIKYYLTILSGFFNYCTSMGIYQENPIVDALKPKKARNSAPYQNLLSTAEIEALLNPVRPSGATRRTWARNYAIVALFLTTAMRNSELRALTSMDLDWKNEVIIVEHGKGNKFRTVPFPKIAQRAINGYLNATADDGGRPMNLPTNAPLFGRERRILGSDAKWEALDRVDLSETVRRHVKIVTGRDGIRTHALRHSSSSYMWDHGVSSDDLSGVLGHSDLKTTQIYLDRLRPTAPAAAASSVFDAKFA